MNHPDELDGRTAVVTGGASGLGFSIATELVRQGAHVALLDVDGDAADAAAKQLSSDGATARGYRVDVSRSSQVDDAFTAVVRDFGQLDISVNNAGIARVGPHTHEVTDEDWAASIGVMQSGVFYGMRAAGRIMLDQGKGSIVNIASIRGFSPNPGRLAYCAAKAAVIMMTKVAAGEWGPGGVRINAIAPGVMRTPMWDSGVAHSLLDEPTYVATVPARRIGDPTEVGQLVAFLGSDRCSYMTGSVLTIDGGLTSVPAG
jgi:NAD(P)-dependent dehydrogenase (short-subunit alcohol dehydrogenase family)